MALTPSQRLEVVKLLADCSDTDYLMISLIVGTARRFSPEDRKTYMNSMVESLQAEKKRLH